MRKKSLTLFKKKGDKIKNWKHLFARYKYKVNDYFFNNCNALFRRLKNGKLGLKMFGWGHFLVNAVI